MKVLIQGGASVLASHCHLTFAAREDARPTRFSSGTCSVIRAALATLILFFASNATAQTTNGFSDADIQGRALAQKVLEQRPIENFTNSGFLKIKSANGNWTNFPIKCELIITATNWCNTYCLNYPREKNVVQMASERVVFLEIDHFGNQFGRYTLNDGACMGYSLKADGANTPFANSDFWLCDLGLEFFHWPQQKVLKKEIHRSCACTVLESTNPNPSTNGYSRVVSWVDTESLGIVEAYAYDANGKKLKNFYPKDIKKVNGQWQVQTLVMENLQTGSKSRLEFDLKK